MYGVRSRGLLDRELPNTYSYLELILRTTLESFKDSG